MYARLAALDRISFRTLAESEDIKRGLASLGYKVLHSPTAIIKLVMEYAEEIKEKIATILKEEIERGGRVSATTDEWTSLKVRRYCAVNAHLKDGRHYGIGMIRGKGTLDAKTLTSMLKERLEKVGLTPNRHVVASTTDGAIVMEAVGRHIVPILHQLCFAHALRLAVTDVVYKASITSIF